MAAGFTPTTLACERRDQSARDALVRRVYGEFYEMPCLRLTAPQAQRLFGLSADVCQRILARLIEEKELAFDSEHRYRLNDSRAWPAGRLFAHQGMLPRAKAS